MSWAVTTDATSRFRAPLLSPGEYELSISAEGFVRAGEAILERIQLSVGDDVRLNLAVSVEPDNRTPAGVNQPVGYGMEIEATLVRPAL